MEDKIMPKVLVPLANGFEEIEAVSLIDVMRRGGIEVMVCALDENLDVLGANSITIKADRPIDGIKAEDIDMIVLPGGWGGTNALAQSEYVQNLLKEMDKNNKLIGAICAAPYALHTAGVLKENFTCYPSVEEQIRTDGYSSDRAVVECGNVITSRGPATAICFGLEIVKKLVDNETYEALKGGLLATYCE
jgi:protein deglycase